MVTAPLAVTFLPLTIAATEAVTCPRREARQPADAALEALRSAVEEADEAAAACWLGLLADCDPPGKRALPGKLNELSEATSRHAGRQWWFSDGSSYRRRVTGAQLRIEDAVRDGDGEEFAEAFAGYDQAVATAVVSAPQTSVPGAGVPLTRRPDDDVTVSHSR